MSNLTEDYYNLKAKDYIKETFECEMGSLYAPFLKGLKGKKKPVILDLGFGSGRDSLFFLKQGAEVYSLDPSAEMIRHGEEIGLTHLIKAEAQELDYDGFFDGIWACASLLHVPSKELNEVFGKCAKALKKGGIMYASFKEGDFEGVRSGREYTDLSLERSEELLKGTGLKIAKVTYTDDVRPGRKDKWMNLYLKLANQVL